GGPLGQYQLHDRLAPAGGGSSRRLIIGITSATNQRGIAQPSWRLVERPACRSSGGNVGVTIQPDWAYRVMRDGWGKQIVVGGRWPGLEFPESFNLPGNNQVLIAAKRDSMLFGKSLRAFADKVNMRAVAQNFSGCPYRVGDPFDASNATRAQGCTVHNQCIQ